MESRNGGPLSLKAIPWRSLSLAFILGAGMAGAGVSCFDTGSGLPWKAVSFPVTMVVDFGPAGKPARSEKIYVERGTTPKEAVSQVFSIQSGKSCCSFRDVLGIDGTVIDPAKNRWWICLLNGSRKFSPHKKKLKRGDVVEWRYIEEAQ